MVRIERMWLPKVFSGSKTCELAGITMHRIKHPHSMVANVTISSPFTMMTLGGMLNTRGIGLGCGKSCKSLSTPPRSWASKTCAKRPGQEFGASPMALWFPMIYDQLLASQPHFLKPFTNQSLFVRFHNECIYSSDFTMNAFINQEIFHNLFTNHSSFLASEAEAAAHFATSTWRWHLGQLR